MRKLVGVVCLLVAHLFVGDPATAQVVTTRILIVGDSVTQANAGDYTWRYRLWKSLQARGASVDFVGPRATLADDSTNYADPDFDQDHAARWGALMTDHGWWVDGHPEDVTEDLVRTYAPDVVVDDLGFNNLRYGVTPEATIDLARNFVADVRAANPRATVILGQLSQRWSAGVDSYNALLLELAADLDRPDAEVLVAPLTEDFTVDDTYDGTHPNAAGEVKIAEQFEDVLVTLQPPARPPAPTPPAPPAPAFTGVAGLAAHPRHHAVRLDFTVPSGATKQAIWRRDVTAGGRWRLVAFVGPRTDHYRVGPLRPRHRQAFRLRSYRGSVASTAYSSVVRAAAR